jgi:pimeloyl-ACP methyl ester carboxylesterase
MAVEPLPDALTPDLPDVPGVRHLLVDVDGVRLHVAEAGRGDPIVLQHGWPQHWYAWRHVIPTLARTRRVIVPDLRGFGWSEAPPGRYEKATFASDLIGLLDALELDQVDLVGHDWGGFAGFLACLRAPDRFRRFLALGINHPWPQADPGALLERLPALSYQLVLAAPLLGELVLMSSPTVIESAFVSAAARPIEPEAARSYATRLQQRPRAAATSALYRTFLLRELPAMVKGQYATGQLTVPTRLVVGSEDPVIKLENLGGFEQHADSMELAEIQGVGHFIPDEAPEEVLEHIRTFVGERLTASANGGGAEAYLHPERQHVEEGLEEVAETADPEAEEGAGADVHVEEPWEGYDGMGVRAIKERLREASPEVRAVVRLYESTHKKRVTVLREVGDG